MNVEFSDEAYALAQKVDAWWRQNRRAAPDLFADELERSVAALATIVQRGSATTRSVELEEVHEKRTRRVSVRVLLTPLGN